MTLALAGPARLQRSRRRGWRVPQGAVYVGRPSRWGNPYREFSRAGNVALFRMWAGLQVRLRGAAWLAPLRGRDLVCWCRPGTPCHADILLELANVP